MYPSAFRCDCLWRSTSYQTGIWGLIASNISCILTERGPPDPGSPSCPANALWLKKGDVADFLLRSVFRRSRAAMNSRRTRYLRILSMTETLWGLHFVRQSEIVPKSVKEGGGEERTEHCPWGHQKNVSVRLHSTDPFASLSLGY